MRNTRPISVTLTHDMSAMVKAKVASGEYATESEVIRDGLRSLQARDQAVERWLRTEVVRSHEELATNPEKAIAASEILERLRNRHDNQLGYIQKR